MKSATLALAIAALLGGSHAQVTLRSTTAFVTAAGSHVTAELEVSGHLATMVREIASTASSRATAKDTYDTNVQSLFTATSGTVRVLFDGVYGTDFGTDFVDGMLTAAEGADVSEEAKDELFEKTMMDMVTMHLVLDKINSNNDRDKWDEAAAYYVGDTGGFSTYDRANKRAAPTDFGTTVSSGDAAINKAIIDALNEEDGDEAKIIELFQVLYLQNVVKYAYEIDEYHHENDFAKLSEVVGEGLAFWRVLKPWLVTRDTVGEEHAATLDGMFDYANIPSNGKHTVQGARHWNYCRAKFIADAHMATLLTLPPDVTLGTYAPFAADDFTCDLAIPTGFESGEYTVGGATYTFTNDVGASLQFSEAIADTKLMLARGDSMTNVQATYEEYGLRGLADMTRIGAEWTLFTGSSGHGSTTWISDLFDRAAVSPNAYVPKRSAQNEIIEKTLMDALAVQCILDDLAHAAETDAHTLDQKRAFIDHAAAKFLGTRNARTSTVFERGNKRGLNYGTASDGINSVASMAILNALKTAKGITGNFAADDTARAAQIAIITKQLKVIYAQATLRYAKLVGDDLAANTAFEEHQAEGMAFFNVIFPWVKGAASTAIVEVVGNIFDVEVAPESYVDFAYCKTKVAMNAFLGSDASLMGTLEDVTADGTTCATVLPSGATGIETDTATYVPMGDVGASLSFSIAVMKMLDELDEPPYTNVVSLFRRTGVAGAGEEARVGEPVYDLFKAYFGDEEWMTTYVEAAADDALTPTTESAARTEMIEKTIWDAVATQLILSDLWRGAQGDTDAHDRHWDHGAAKYLGTDDERAVTVYKRAEKRAANFGTTTNNAAGDPEANVNYAVIAALTAGKTAASATLRFAEYEKVKHQILVIYSQCVLRYANYLDAAFLDRTEYAEHQAEGQAFWRVIAPFVKAVNANGATFLTGIFDLSREVSEHTHYCRAYDILSDLSVTTAEIGTLEDIRNPSCDGVEVPEDATEYLAATPSSSDAEKTVAVSVGVVVSLALALVM